MTEIVDYATASQEIEGWLDYQQIMPLQRKEFKGSIEVLKEGIQYGVLSLKDNAFTQKLFTPVGKSEISEIKYKARIQNSKELAPFKKSTTGEGGEGLILAVWSCLTADAQPDEVYKLLDKADKRFAGSIVVFFLET